MRKKITLTLAVIFLIAFLLRLPSLFEPYSYADEGIYLVLGQALRKGLVWYRDIHDNKPPMLYLLAALSGSVFWFRFLLLLWNFLNIALIFKLAKNLFEEKMALMVTFLFAILSTIRLFEGQMANAEIFMIMPITAAILLLCNFQFPISNFQTERNRWKAYFLAGVLFSIATLFKMPAGFDFMGIIFFLIFFSGQKIIQSIKQTLLMSLGFVLPIFGTMSYYWSQGALMNYLRAAFLQNIGYLASWSGKPATNITSSGLTLRGAILLAVVLLIFLLRKRLTKEFLLVFIWFCFSLFGALLSERPYPHYLMQVVPAISLSIGFILVKNNWQRLAAGLAVFSLLFSFFYFKFWHYQSLPYYQTFYQYLIRQKNKEEWRGFFGGHIKEIEQVAEIVKEKTTEKERIFVWGTEPGIYYLADRLPVGRYTVAYHIKDFNGWEETMKALKKKPPRLIIKLKDEQKFPDLESWLQENYQFHQIIGNAEIFERKNGLENEEDDII